jgi:hypothetical protein
MALRGPFPSGKFIERDKFPSFPAAHSEKRRCDKRFLESESPQPRVPKRFGFKMGEI